MALDRPFQSKMTAASVSLDKEVLRVQTDTISCLSYLWRSVLASILPAWTRGVLSKLTRSQAKRRSAGEIHRPSGETEEWTTRPLGQEVAELLGQATAQSLELDGWKDQHALVASTHGTVVRLTAADIKESYLSHLNSPTMPISECLFVVRSQGYDLRTREERDGALLLFIGVIEYLKSERAIIGQLQAIRGEAK